MGVSSKSDALSEVSHVLRFPTYRGFPQGEAVGVSSKSDALNKVSHMVRFPTYRSFPQGEAVSVSSKSDAVSDLSRISKSHINMEVLLLNDIN